MLGGKNEIGWLKLHFYQPNNLEKKSPSVFHQLPSLTGYKNSSIMGHSTTRMAQHAATVTQRCCAWFPGQRAPNSKLLWSLRVVHLPAGTRSMPKHLPLYRWPLAAPIAYVITYLYWGWGAVRRRDGVPRLSPVKKRGSWFDLSIHSLLRPIRWLRVRKEKRLLIHPPSAAGYSC